MTVHRGRKLNGFWITNICSIFQHKTCNVGAKAWRSCKLDLDTWKFQIHSTSARVVTGRESALKSLPVQAKTFKSPLMQIFRAGKSYPSPWTATWAVRAGREEKKHLPGNHRHFFPSWVPSEKSNPCINRSTWRMPALSKFTFSRFTNTFCGKGTHAMQIQPQTAPCLI